MNKAIKLNGYEHMIQQKPHPNIRILQLLATRIVTQIVMLFTREPIEVSFKPSSNFSMSSMAIAESTSRDFMLSGVSSPSTGTGAF